MILYEKKLYIALIFLLIVFLYYNLALEKLVEEEIQEITDEKESVSITTVGATERVEETTTVSTTSATTETPSEESENSLDEENSEDDVFSRLDSALLDHDLPQICHAIEDIIGPEFHANIVVEQPLSDHVEIPPPREPNSYEEMASRKLILRRACSVESLFNSIRTTTNLSFSDKLRQLHQLHQAVGDPENPEYEKFKEMAEEPERKIPVGEFRNRYMFLMDNFKMMPCFPLKTGTTNWQKALSSLNYVDENRVPHVAADDIPQANVFKELPRYHSRYNVHVFRKLRKEHPSNINNCIFEGLERRVNDDNYLKWINPRKRLFSAWHQKFDSNYEGFWSYKKYVPGIRTFEDENSVEDTRYLVSFNAFLKYIVHVASDLDFNEHWQSYDWSCSPCSMNYHFVTKQESSAADASFILRQRNLTDITYLPGAYDDHTEASPKEIFNAHGISNEIALQLYAIYYPDFIMYNYSIDEFLE